MEIKCQTAGHLATSMSSNLNHDLANLHSGNLSLRDKSNLWELFGKMRWGDVCSQQERLQYEALLWKASYRDLDDLIDFELGEINKAGASHVV